MLKKCAFCRGWLPLPKLEIGNFTCLTVLAPPLSYSIRWESLSGKSGQSWSLWYVWSAWRVWSPSWVSSPVQSSKLVHSGLCSHNLHNLHFATISVLFCASLDGFSVLFTCHESFSGLPPPRCCEKALQIIWGVQTTQGQPERIPEVDEICWEGCEGEDCVPGLWMWICHKKGPLGASQELLCIHPIQVLCLQSRNECYGRVPHPLQQVSCL